MDRPRVRLAETTGSSTAYPPTAHSSPCDIFSCRYNDFSVEPHRMATLDASLGAIMAKRGELSGRGPSGSTSEAGIVLSAKRCANCSIERAGASPSLKGWHQLLKLLHCQTRQIQKLLLSGSVLRSSMRSLTLSQLSFSLSIPSTGIKSIIVISLQ